MGLPVVLQTDVEKYSYIERGSDRILSWDNARFMNHHCDANTLSTRYGFEIAIREIKKGEELCDDYGLLNIGKPLQHFCKNTPGCRKKVFEDDLVKYSKFWDGRYLSFNNGNIPI